MNLDNFYVKFAMSVTNFLSLEREKEIISRFYDELVSDLTVRYSVQDRQIEQAIGNLVCNYRYKRCCQTPNCCDYDDICSCIGYLHQYASCHSRMVFAVIYELWRSSRIEIFYLRMQNTLEVTFIGSGPGNDFVGFLSAIHGMYGFLQNMNVTFVDKMQGWEKVVWATAEKLQNGGCGMAGNVYRNVNIRRSFLNSDITNSLVFDHQLQTNLRSTDVVFLVKVLSTIPDGRKLRALNNIVTNMKPGAILIFIDCPFPASLATFNSCLREIYQKMRNQYSCSTRTRFGHSNIPKCTAEVKVYAKI